MTQALLTTALLLVAHSAVGTACNGVPEIDWSEVENLARSFVSKPAPETAEALAAALPSADTIVLPPRSASLREALEKSRAITLDAVDDSTAWAVQLGLRFLRLGDSMFEPKLTAKIQISTKPSRKLFVSGSSSRNSRRVSRLSSPIYRPSGFIRAEAGAFFSLDEEGVSFGPHMEST